MLCIDKGGVCDAINRLLVFFREYVARRVEIVELIAIRVEEQVCRVFRVRDNLACPSVPYMDVRPSDKEADSTVQYR